MVLSQNIAIESIKANTYQKAISQIIRDIRNPIEYAEYNRSKKNLTNAESGELLASEGNSQIVYIDPEELNFKANKESLIKVKKILISWIHNYITEIDFSDFNMDNFKDLELNLEKELQNYIEEFNKEFATDIEKGKIEKIEFSILNEKIQNLVNFVSIRARELLVA